MAKPPAQARADYAGDPVYDMIGVDFMEGSGQI
jgi:hypothetical protein